MYGYRREVAAHREWLKTLFLPSLLGGALGAVLLLRTPARSFQRLAPFLILFATVLFMLQGAVARWARSGEGHPAREQAPGRWVAAWLYQFGVGVYGGYFGAGIGILMLAVLGFLGLSDIHAANGIKNFFGMCINGLAAGYFIIRGAVDWPAALVMIGGAIIGGYGGAGFARRIGRDKARAAVIVIGFLVAAILLFQSPRRSARSTGSAPDGAIPFRRSAPAARGSSPLGDSSRRERNRMRELNAAPSFSTPSRISERGGAVLATLRARRRDMEALAYFTSGPVVMQGRGLGPLAASLSSNPAPFGRSPFPPPAAFQLLQEDLESGQSALPLAPASDFSHIDSRARGDAHGDFEPFPVVPEIEARSPRA
jgi:uncharacterized membrane protein YfcA